MADPGATTNPEGRAPTFEADGRCYGLPHGSAADPAIEQLADAIAPFIENIWASLVELPLAAGEAPGHGGDALPLRVTVPVPGDRWIRIACEPELARVIGAHVFDQSPAEVDIASSRMAMLELASTIATHAAVIEHPAWPWTAPAAHASVTSERAAACELWFDSRGHRVAVALLYRPRA
jgi:hypothetical protein